MGFIDENARIQRVEKVDSDNSAAVEKRRAIYEAVERFLDEENIASIVLKVGQAAAREFIREGGPLKSVRIDEDTVSPYVSRSRDCRASLLKALQAAEPATISVELIHNPVIQDSNEERLIRVIFEPPLT